MNWVNCCTGLDYDSDVLSVNKVFFHSAITVPLSICMYSTCSSCLSVQLLLIKCFTLQHSDTEQTNNKRYFYIQVCVFLRGLHGVLLQQKERRTHTDTHGLLTVMYLTSMSVFLSSSVIISLWNFLNFRWGGWWTREERGRRHAVD